jgi:predicted GTPase
MIAAAGPSDGPEKQQQQNRQLQLYHKPWTIKSTTSSIAIVAMADNIITTTTTRRMSQSLRNAPPRPPPILAMPQPPRRRIHSITAQTLEAEEDSSANDLSSSIR